MFLFPSGPGPIPSSPAPKDFTSDACPALWFFFFIAGDYIL